jgi:hypothetical protein
MTNHPNDTRPLHVGIISNLAQHPMPINSHRGVNQRIVDRAKVTYDAILDSPEFRADLGRYPLFGGPLSRNLEVMIGEIVEFAIEFSLIEKRI